MFVDTDGSHGWFERFKFVYFRSNAFLLETLRRLILVGTNLVCKEQIKSPFVSDVITGFLLG